MSRYLTIGYGDEAGYRRTDQELRDRAHAHDARLLSQGAVIAVAGQPLRVRNPAAAGLDVEAGAYLRSDLPVAGFALIEAEDVDAAVRLAAETPCAIAHGVVEVWPLIEPSITP